MRKLLSIAAFLFISITSYGQLKPPQQTDTLTIKSVNYIYSEILEENWPYKHILKSMTHFQFGDQKCKIKKVEELTYSGTQLQFVLSNDNGTPSILTYEVQGGETIKISFSGYEFICVLSRNKPRIVQAKKQEVVTEAEAPVLERPINHDALFSPKQNESGAKGNIDGGHGNLAEGDVYSRPIAELDGRRVLSPPRHPSYNIRQSGKVVVTIKVDRDGRVVEAQPGGVGTTLADKQAWEAAQKSAIKIQFNAKSDAPEYQYGTVTYVFY